MSQNYTYDSFTTNGFGFTGTAMANATARGCNNPATIYRSTNDSSVQEGGVRSSQEDNGESERYPRDLRGDPGSQSVNRPQSIGQPRSRAVSRAGQADQSDSHPTREDASVPMLELIDRHMNHSQGTHIRAQVVAGVHINGWRPQTVRSQCQKGTKASIKIAALNIHGMGNTNTWHPDNKWNHINQIMKTKRIGILIVGEAHLNNERRNAIENMPRSRLCVIHSEDPVSPNARGVAIVLNKELMETEDVNAIEIIPG